MKKCKGKKSKIVAVVFVTRYMIKKHGWEGAVRRTMERKSKKKA